MADRLDPDELRRLNSWVGAIAQHLRPDAPIAHTPEGLRLGRKGSLAITADGAWFNHESGTGGKDALTLIAHLRDCKPAGAVLWARTFLAEHPGDGELNGAEAAAEAGERRASYARQILDEAGDPEGTPASIYLEGRGIAAPYPPCIRWLPDARLGESAVVGILTNAAGAPVGMQLGYLDPAGRKSVVQPQRQMFFIEKNDQAAFRISAPEPAEDAAELVICEGLEDGLSVIQAGAANAAIVVPGIGRSGKLDLPPGTDVVVFRDGDDAGSQAAKQLCEATDRWLLAGARVLITNTPAGADANSILVTKGQAELRRLVAEASLAELSFNADVVRLARLDAVEYERERQAAARRHGVRVAFIDAAVKTARGEAEAERAEEDEDEAPHLEPVADLAPVLDDALRELQGHVVAREHDLGAAVLWAAHAHLVHHEKVWLPISPKLAIQSPDRGCGKTTMLEVIGALVPRPETGSSITAAATFRLIESRRPSLLLDEADRVLRDSSSELLAVLNSSHRRSGAYVWRVEEIGGTRVPCKFSTWAAVAFAGIRELPATLQDRSVAIRLARAKPGEVKAHLRHGTSPTLRTLKRKLARWSADLIRLPQVQLPSSLHNRTGDNWLPLFEIAALAGGRWPSLVQQAALASLGADQKESDLVALLDGIRRAFGEQARLSTRAMLDFLIADDEFDWTTANRGKVVNEAYLRERLRGVITPGPDGRPGSEQWRAGRIRERGYTRTRFLDAWQRYLPSQSPENARDNRATRDTAANQRKENGQFGTVMDDATCDAASHAGHSKGNGADATPRHTCKNTHPRRKKPTKSKPVTDGPGVTDNFGLNERGIPTDGELGPEELL